MSTKASSGPLEGIAVTADPYFKWLDLDKVAEVMVSPAIVDGRNLLDRSRATHAGVSYRGIGRDRPGTAGGWRAGCV